ncbi:MAG: hypothetical protein LIQ30_03300 [Planctomycetes bacterium]|nr:hypothetical protein [Planctomycetota bacterium]MCD7898259.1 hypothetical protein [Planctomycetaceae bacterium]
MTVSQKIRLRPTTLPDFLPGYDEDTFISTMSDEEKDRIIEHYSELMDQGKEEEAEKVFDQIPCDPSFILTQLVLLGREDFLEMGLNTADAEKAYGADWLDRFDVGGGVLHFTKG